MLSRCSETKPPLSFCFSVSATMSPFGVLAGLFFLLLALYCGTDPLRHSAISDFPDFESYRVDMPPWSQVPTEKDTQNLLQNSEIKFLNQVQGPESVAFDPLGRGPYAGVADGRVVFWNGQSWIDFAYTSPNRSVFLFLFLFFGVMGFLGFCRFMSFGAWWYVLWDPYHMCRKWGLIISAFILYI